MPPSPSPIERLNAAWRRLSGLPGGKWMFSQLLGATAPYTGSVKPLVEELRPGYARVSMPDRRAVRNHLASVHAIALANLGEVSSGLATLSGVSPTTQGILVGLSIEYLKKARGTLVAECTANPPMIVEPTEYTAVAEIRDTSGDIVARVSARWRLRNADGLPPIA